MAQLVTTQFGPVQGAINGAVYEFLGIPFAKPPVGNLRWTPPQNPDTWTATLNTIAFAPACPQKQYTQGDTTYTLLGNEDCLYLNVWTPQTGAGQNKPVMVFIHGGGNQQGSASEIAGGTYIYSGKNLSQRGDVVVVTIQYRLGPLGFLVHPGLEPENSVNTSGNYAVMDQILALTWVKNNIAAFGGDPGRVMVFGESAGGVNTGNLLTTPLAAGLFHRACIQSAGPVISDYASARTKGISYVDSFITSGTDVQKIAYLRTLPADSLLSYRSSAPLQGGVVQQNWQAVVDGVVFGDRVIPVVQSGVFNKMPLMIGSNSEEMSLSAPLVVTPGMVSALIAALVPAPLQAQATALYPPGQNNTEARESYVALLSDFQFTSAVRRTAECVYGNQTDPVWRYFFTHHHTLLQLAPYGAYHGMELFYVFNNWENATLGSGPLFKPADDSVQNAMLRYWVNFAATGNPNDPGLPVWPQFQAGPDCYLELKATPDGTQCGVRTPHCDLWDTAAGFIGCTSSLHTQDNQAEKGGARLYPNPAGAFAILETDRPVQQVTIFSIQGIPLRNIHPAQNSIHLSDLPPGAYYLQIKYEDNSAQVLPFLHTPP